MGDRDFIFSVTVKCNIVYETVCNIILCLNKNYNLISVLLTELGITKKISCFYF